MVDRKKLRDPGIVPEGIVCPHGHRHYCGFCMTRGAPHCKKHGNPWYCGHCGKVEWREAKASA